MFVVRDTLGNPEHNYVMEYSQGYTTASTLNRAMRFESRHDAEGFADYWNGIVENVHLIVEDISCI